MGLFLINTCSILADIGSAPSRSDWVAVVVALVLVGGVALAAFMTSRRSHRD